MKIVVVTGLSGGGKSTALRALEDLGYFCCDNLPVSLLSTFQRGLEEQGIEKSALSVDGRQLPFMDDFMSEVKSLRGAGHDVEILFIEARDDLLIRRYTETRRRHPLSAKSIAEGIARDREALAELEKHSSRIDTSSMNVHELKRLIWARYSSDSTPRLAVFVQSFGFKYGLPTDLQVVFDVRHLPNPYFDVKLRPLDGREESVSTYVFSFEEAEGTLSRIEDYLRYTLPLAAQEGKVYVNVGIGCTGGKHRSVALSEELGNRLGDEWSVLIRHRDVGMSKAKAMQKGSG